MEQYELRYHIQQIKLRLKKVEHTINATLNNQSDTEESAEITHDEISDIVKETI